MGRWLLAIVLAGCVLVPVACAKSSGSKEEFCAKLPKTGDLMTIMSDFSGTTPAELQQRFETGLAEYRDLERAAPRSIRSDVAKVADTVDLILQVVRRHPDDLGAIRNDLAGKATSLASAGKSALAVASYAQKECRIDLNNPGPADLSTTSVP